MGYKHLFYAAISSLIVMSSSPAIADEPQREMHLERMVIRVNKTTSLEEKITEIPKIAEIPNNPLNLKDRYNYNSTDLEKNLSQIDRCIKQSQNNNSCLIVDKAAHEMSLYQNQKKIASYPVELGLNHYKDKRMLGDNCTPEGIYNIKFVHKNSAFYKALYLNYPHQEDRKEFKQLKKESQISKKAKIGGNIEIHGSGAEKESDQQDWTVGCIALPNSNIDSLYQKLGLENYETMNKKELTELTKRIKVCIVKYGTKTEY
jgi:murein L,D-transpeptidase YafK